jgi:hypothetical protein
METSLGHASARSWRPLHPTMHHCHPVSMPASLAGPVFTPVHIGPHPLRLPANRVQMLPPQPHHHGQQRFQLRHALPSLPPRARSTGAPLGSGPGLLLLPRQPPRSRSSGSAGRGGGSGDGPGGGGVGLSPPQPTRHGVGINPASSAASLYTGSMVTTPLHSSFLRPFQP